MSTEQERRRQELADQLSQALGAAAELMTERIQASPAPSTRPARDRRSSRRGGRLPGWLVPLAAAAAVAVVVAGSLLVSRIHFGASQPSSATSGPPAFYLTLGTGISPQVEVHRASDGAVTGTVPSTREWSITAMSATAGDRTFFVSETPVQNPAKPNLCPANRFLRFDVTATGAVTGLRQAGRQVAGLNLQLAASPDGTRLAYWAYCGSEPAWGLHVMNLASGAVSSWTSNWAGSVNTTSPADVSGPAQISWTADGRSLALNYQWKGSSQAYLAYQAVLLLNISSKNGPIQDHSRVLWHQGPGCKTFCVYYAQLSPDGTSLVASATKIVRLGGDEYAMSLERISLPDGRVSDVLFHTTIFSQVTGGVPALQLTGDSSATYWLVQVGKNLGWVSDGQFHLLQPYGTIRGAAW
jgi:hypothetical protein